MQVPIKIVNPFGLLDPLALDYVMPEDLRNGLELNQLFDKCLVDVNDVQKE